MLPKCCGALFHAKSYTAFKSHIYKTALIKSANPEWFVSMGVVKPSSCPFLCCQNQCNVNMWQLLHFAANSSTDCQPLRLQPFVTSEIMATTSSTFTTIPVAPRSKLHTVTRDIVLTEAQTSYKALWVNSYWRWDISLLLSQFITEGHDHPNHISCMFATVWMEVTKEHCIPMKLNFNFPELVL